MLTRQWYRWSLILFVGGLMSLGLVGCDYWPPALQAQIEQLRAELQSAAADKALLQNQLNAATKAREELQLRVEELTRINKEKSAMIASLERSVAAAKQRAVSSKSSRTKPTPSKKSSSKRTTSKPRKPATRTR